MRAASTAIAVRVSIVAEPRCGIEHRVLELEQAGVHLRLVLEHVEAGAGDHARRERLGERGLVDDRAACRVDEVGVAAHLAQPRGRDQMRRLGRERAVERDDVARLEQLVELDEAGLELGLDAASARRRPL